MLYDGEQPEKGGMPGKSNAIYLLRMRIDSL